MKVYGPASSTAVAGRPARASSGGFAPEAGGEAEPSATAAHAGALSSVATLETLLALQEATTPMERRRKAVRRAGRILDALEDLRVAVLDPLALEGTALQRLQGAVREARGETQDAGLDEVLEQVELRAAVELAKRETRAAA